MRILMVAAEVAPYSTVGGLSQVVYFLAYSLIKLGHDVRVFSAKYGIIQPKRPFKKILRQIKIPTGYQGKVFPQELICNVVANRTGPLKVYFLENREYFELRSNVYEYADDPTRFFLLSRGCLEWLKSQRAKKLWLPQLIHLHDWHTGYLGEDLRTNDRYRREFYRLPVLLTVHNFHLQGKMNFQLLPKDKQDSGREGLKHFFHDKLIRQNSLLRGIIHADWVNTVSETYAREILTKGQGEGLEETLNLYRGKLSGILNGIDTKEFNPLTDPLIRQNYSRNRLYLRKKNKADLQAKFGLPVNEHIPILAYSGRLSKQKGIDLLLDCLPKLAAELEFQCIVLGQENMTYGQELQKLKDKFPDKISLHLYSDFKLPRKIFAGADMILLPSLFEPCGIVAIEALRYGAVPLVRKTGGLSDIVTDFSPETMTGNGLVFNKPNVWSLFAAVIRGIQLYHVPHIWKRLVDNALACNFSWDKAAVEYENLYRRTLRLRERLIRTNPVKLALRPRSESNRRIAVLQTAAFPLRH